MNLSNVDDYIPPRREYSRKYNQENKDKINEKKRKYTTEKIECECGLVISRSSKYNHVKTPYHQLEILRKNGGIYK